MDRFAGETRSQATCIQVGGALVTAVLSAVIPAGVAGAQLSASLAGTAAQGIVPDAKVAREEAVEAGVRRF